MGKSKNCSFYFITSIFIKKFFCFAILFSAVAIVANGFFIFNVYAESVTSDFVVTSGTDASGVPEPLTTADINRLSISDNDSMQNNAGWPSEDAYDESKYLEFEFNPIIPDNVNLTNVLVTNEYYRSGTLLGAKLELENGTEIPLSLPSVVGYPGEVSETIDIVQYINNPLDLQNFKIKFLAYRGGGITTTKTGHDFIGLTVIYEEDSFGGDPDPDPSFYTEVTEDISADTLWVKENSPYVISSPIYVLEDVTLLMSEGVIVKFNNEGSLIVNGKLEAQGTVESPIYFTSILDDSVGGDTNDDGDNTTPSEGDWDYIFVDSVGSQSILNNVVEKYSDMGLILYDGGSVISNNFNSDKGILAFGSNSSFTNLVIPKIELFDGSTITIDSAVISNEDDTSVVVQNGSSLILKNSTVQGAGYSIVVVSESSTADFNSVEIAGDSSLSTAFSVYEDSSLDISNSSVTDNYNGFYVYDNSSLDIQNTDVECSNDGISVYHNSNLNLSGGNISCFNYGILLFNEVNVNIEEVKISGALDTGVIAYNNTTPNTIMITKSEITGNNYGFYIFNSLISAHQNNIHDNFTNGAFTFMPVDLDFTSNYWGDPSGPIHATNPNGMGDVVSDNILFVPFLIEEPSVEVLEVRHPVILIPGITGTYLYKNYDDNGEIWPNLSKILLPGDDLYLNDLALNVDGTEKTEYPMIVEDIIRGVPSLGIDVFNGLISELVEAEYVEGTDLFVFPYDWRKSTTENAILLKEKIDNIIVDGEYEKVDIVAHSMGGLMAKEYIVENGGNKVDHLIFLGTPQLGAPKAFKVLMYGDNMGYGFSIFKLNPIRTKFISQNMPAVYELLPSEKYIENNGSYVANGLNRDIDPIDLDYSGTKDFMIGNGRNAVMFPFAENLHENIDNLNLSGIDTYNFVGCGTKTIGEITIKQKKSWKKLFLGWIDDITLKYVNGDETVPLVSADKAIGASLYYAKDISHGALPSADGVKQNILAILIGTELQDSPNILTDASTCNVSGKTVSAHSPVELHIYDEEGNHTGPNVDGDIEYNIDGVQYDVVEGEKYAFLPDGVNYKIVTKAEDIGGYNFMIEDQDENDNITAIYDWTLVPLKTLDTQGEIWIGPDYSPVLYEVKIDEDGDGIIDRDYPASFDGTTFAEEYISEQEKENQASAHHTSGSIVMIDKQNQIPQFPFVENRTGENADKFFEDNKIAFEQDMKDKENDDKGNQGQDELQDQELKNSLSASAGGSDIKVNLLWPVIIIFGLISLLLAKMFIKL